MEVVDIDLDTIPLRDVAYQPQEKPSVSFGGGIELLMNEKKKSSSASTKIDLDEFDIQYIYNSMITLFFLNFLVFLIFFYHI